MAKAKPAPLPAGSTVGDYRIVRSLASGGSSIVYLAHNEAGQAVLLKEFLPGALMHRPVGQFEPLVRPGMVERVRRGLHGFLDGARNLVYLQNPSLASVLDCVQANDTAYLVSRYLEGHTLQAYIVAARSRAALGALSEATVISVGIELLQALGVVHGAGLLHLDIKPANVLLTLEDTVVLLDFDAAQPYTGEDHWEPARESDRGDPRARPAFTPGFSAPETMAHAAALGPWTDLYAVGACLFACMLGHPPPDCLSRAQSDRVAESLHSVRSLYSGALREAVRHSLGLGSSMRPRSVREMLDTLAPAAQSAAVALAASTEDT